MKGVRKVIAYQIPNGRLFIDKDQAGMQAELLAERVKEVKILFSSLVSDQTRDKRSMKGKRGREAAEMQSIIARRSLEITQGIEFIKKNRGWGNFTLYKKD